MIPMTDAVTPALACRKCNASLHADSFNTAGPTMCLACGVTMYAAVFPAFLRPVERGQTGETIVSDGEAGCFYHASKKATVMCEVCGRFLCALCDIKFAGRNLCPACVASGRRKGTLRNSEKQRMLHDDMAIALAIGPMLIPLFGWICTIATAPMAIVMSLWYWRKGETSIIPRTRIRYILAILIALPQIAGWIAFCVFLLRR
jgi:hypothetical protein